MKVWPQIKNAQIHKRLKEMAIFQRKKTVHKWSFKKKLP